MRMFLVIVLAALAACTDPSLNASVRIGPGGVSVSPSIGGTIGGLGVSVSG